MPYIYFNKQIIPLEEFKLNTGNRAFLYGDGFFETMMADAGGIYLWNYHVERLNNACNIFQIRPEEDIDTLKTIIRELFHKNNFQRARVKIHVSREEGGLYLPTGLGGVVTIMLYPEEAEYFQSPLQERTAGVYQVPLKLINAFSQVKNLNCIPFVQASLWAKQQGFDDAFILNQNLRPAELTSSNFFLFYRNALVTPHKNEGCIIGVMRNFLLANLQGTDFEVREKSLQTNDLYQATYIIATNASGIRLVNTGKVPYGQAGGDYINSLHQMLKPAYFETKSVF